MSAHELRIVIPEDHYTLFDSTRADLPEIIEVNDALLLFAHLDVFPWHLKIVLEAEDLIENGMPSEEDGKLLFSIGDEIEEAVLSARTVNGGQNALYLARSTWNGTRELMYQVHDPEITHPVLQRLLAGRKWGRRWNYTMKFDLVWSEASYVFQLFPQATGSDA